jgi:phage major head subunit gpT-like protein
MLNKMYEVWAELAITAMPGQDVHQEANFGKLLFPGLRKIFYETYDEVPEQYSKVFKVNKSTKAKETDYGLGAFSPWTKFGSNYTTGAVAGTTEMPKITYQTIPNGLERTYIHEEFASGFAVERKFKDDEDYRIINKMPADLARAGRYKVESDAVGIFNDGFTTNGYDGKPLFSASHPLLKTTAVTEYGTGVCSNLVDAAFSFDSLKTATTMFRKQVDEAGKLIQMKPDTLIVPPSQEWLAYELVKTSQKPGGNLNDVNALMGKFKILVWDFLTDDDAVYLIDSTRHQLNFFWRVKPEFKHEEEFDSLVAKYRGYMRYSFGYSDWRGVVAIKDVL